MLTIYSCKGCGSVVIETACELLGQTYRVREVKLFQPGADADVEELRKLNPLGQVPTVVLPDGTVMTESLAILLWLLEQHPESSLAPAVGHAKRPAFLRWLVFLAASIYPMYTIGDFPARWVALKDAQQQLVDASVARTLDCWRMVEQALLPQRFLLGDELTILDVYVAMMSRWRPGRERIRAVAPLCMAVADRVEQHEVVAKVFARHFGS